MLSTQVFCYLSKQLPLGQANFCLSAEPFNIAFKQRQLEAIIMQANVMFGRVQHVGAVIRERAEKMKVTVLYYCSLSNQMRGSNTPGTGV